MFCHGAGPGSGSFARHRSLLAGPRSRTPRCRRRVPLPRMVRARPRVRGGGRDPCRSVMECHVLSWGRSPSRPFAPGRRSVPLPRIMRVRASRPTPPPVGGGSWFRSFVPPWGQRAGRSVPVSRVSCAGGCAGGRAYRGGAVCARDCPRARARGSGPGTGRTPPACSRRGFCGPQPCFLQKAERRSREPPFSAPILHHSSGSQAISGTKNDNTGLLSHNSLTQRGNIRFSIRRFVPSRNGGTEDRDKSAHDGRGRLRHRFRLPTAGIPRDRRADF